MSTILATCNFKTGKWTIEKTNLDPDWVDLRINFKYGQEKFDFKNLRFFYRLTTGNNIISLENYPPTGIEYVQSDQKFIISEHIDLTSNTTYDLYISATNDGRHFEHSVTFTTPRYPQPFVSWEWNNSTNNWEPPITYPTDGNFYIWNEETVSWKQQDPNKASDE